MRNKQHKKYRKWMAGIVVMAVLAAESISPAWAAESAMDVMCEPCGIVQTEDGSFLVTDTYHKLIWKVVNRESTIYAGGHTVEDPYGEPLGGYHDATLEFSYFKEPWAIVPYLDGYAVSDAANDVVRLIRADHTQTVNSSTQENLLIGTGVKYSRPTGLAADEEGSLYIADTNNHAIRKITKTGQVTTYAENLLEPTGLCYKNGTLYVAESGAHRILRIVGGQVEVIAGDGNEGNADGMAFLAQFSSPQGVAVSDDGIIYVSDTGNNAVRKIQDGTVTTLIACDQTQMQPYPIAPMGLMVRENLLYVCDRFSRKVFVLER